MEQLLLALLRVHWGTGYSIYNSRGKALVRSIDGPSNKAGEPLTTRDT